MKNTQSDDLALTSIFWGILITFFFCVDEASEGGVFFHDFTSTQVALIFAVYTFIVGAVIAFTSAANFKRRWVKVVTQIALSFVLLNCVSQILTLLT